MQKDHVDRIVELWGATDPSLDVSSLHVAGRILRAAVHLERVREAALRPHGLSLGDFDVLATLKRVGGADGVNPKHLADNALITSGAMTSRLDRLQGLRLVERRPDPADRRSVLVRLTRRGRVVAARALDDVLASHRRFLAPLTAGQSEDAASALRAILIGTGDH